MSEQTKCCGNCRWWKQLDKHKCGECKCPVPSSQMWFDKYIVAPTDYEDCPCFAPPIPHEVLDYRYRRAKGLVERYEDFVRKHDREPPSVPLVVYEICKEYIENIQQLKGNQ